MHQGRTEAVGLVANGSWLRGWGKPSVYKNSWQPGRIVWGACGKSLKTSSDEQVRHTPVKNDLGRVAPTLGEGDGLGDFSRSLSLLFSAVLGVLCMAVMVWEQRAWFCLPGKHFTLKWGSFVYLSVWCFSNLNLINFSGIPQYKLQWVYEEYLRRQILKSINLLIRLIGVFHLE